MTLFAYEGHRVAAAFALLMLAGTPATVAAQQPLGPAPTVVELPTRPGVTVRLATLAPDGTPRGAVVLFVGGQGLLNIPDRPGPGWQSTGNFLARSREEFRARGLYVVLMDAPSDRRQGLVNGFRLTADHAADMAAVIAEVRRRAPNVSVWLVGTSRGSISAASVAARVGGAEGIVLTSSVTRHSGGGQSRDAVIDVDLAAIRVPALVVSHRADGCEVSPSHDAAMLLRRLASAPRKEILMFQGGDPPQSAPCEARSAHGFLGIEGQVVGAIVDWMFKG